MSHCCHCGQARQEQEAQKRQEKDDCVGQEWLLSRDKYGMYEKLVLVVFDQLFYELSLELHVLIVLLGLVVVERMVQPELCQYALALICPGILLYVHFPLLLFCCCGRLWIQRFNWWWGFLWNLRGRRLPRCPWLPISFAVWWHIH